MLTPHISITNTVLNTVKCNTRKQRAIVLKLMSEMLLTFHIIEALLGISV